MPEVQQPKSSVPMATAQHLVEFFALYPRFQYNPKAPVNAEFRRLKTTYGWTRDSKEDKQAWKSFGKAMGKQFATFYGSRINDINAWQALCMALDVDPIPHTIKECKAIIQSTHVNLVDFIDIRTTGKPVEVFETEEELREYTKEQGKIYPRESAKESGVLKYLLRHIFI